MHLSANKTRARMCVGFGGKIANACAKLVDGRTFCIKIDINVHFYEPIYSIFIWKDTQKCLLRRMRFSWKVRTYETCARVYHENGRIELDA